MMPLIRYVLPVLAAAALAAVGAQAKSGSSSAEIFARKAASVSAFALESGKLALEKSKNEAVKAFAQKTAEDHAKAAEALQKALAASTVKPDAVPQTPDARRQEALDRLQRASGKDFDKEYIRAQREALGEAVAAFMDCARDGRDRALRTFAAQTLPALKEHQKQAGALKAR